MARPHSTDREFNTALRELDKIMKKRCNKCGHERSEHLHLGTEREYCPKATKLYDEFESIVEPEEIYDDTQALLDEIENKLKKHD